MVQASPSDVLVDVTDRIGRITLNRPARHNALLPSMYQSIEAAVRSLDADPDVGVIILQGAGKSFSSGYDLAEEGDGTLARTKWVFDLGNAARWAVWRSSTPVIARIHGYCLGGAFELAAPADFSICAESAQLGEPEIRFGSGSAFLLLPWLCNVKRSKELLMTGKRISGPRAERLGIVTECVPDDALDEAVHQLAQTLLELPADALAEVKQGINESYETMGLPSAISSWERASIMLSHTHDADVDVYLTYIHQA